MNANKNARNDEYNRESYRFEVSFLHFPHLYRVASLCVLLTSLERLTASDEIFTFVDKHKESQSTSCSICYYNGMSISFYSEFFSAFKNCYSHFKRLRLMYKIGLFSRILTTTDLFTENIFYFKQYLR